MDMRYAQNLQVPTALLLCDHASKYQLISSETLPPCSLAADLAKSTKPDCKPSDDMQPAKQAAQRQKYKFVIHFICFFCMFSAGLLLLSEMQLRHYPEHFTSSIFATSSVSQINLQPTLPLGASQPMHWMRHVYGYMLTVRPPVSNADDFAILALSKIDNV